MSALFLARGAGLSLSAAVSASEGDTSIDATGMPAFDTGAPLFLSLDATGETFCLGRVQGAGASSVSFAWALEQDVAESATLFQPADWVAIPRHLKPLEHAEYQLGLAERDTSGGTALAVERTAARELLRLRLPAPPARTLEAIFSFVKGLRAAGTLLFTVVDGRRRVRRVALAQENAEFGTAEFEPGDPFDLIVRTDAESRYA